MTKMRVFQNVSQVPLEICEVGKPIKKRIVVLPGEKSPAVKVSQSWTDYITTQTGFALLLEETEVADDVPEGYIETTEVGDKNRKFRPMTPEERTAAGLEAVVVQPAPTQPATVTRPAVVGAQPPLVQPKPAVVEASGTATGTSK